MGRTRRSSVFLHVFVQNGDLEESCEMWWRFPPQLCLGGYLDESYKMEGWQIPLQLCLGGDSDEPCVPIPSMDMLSR